MIIIGIDPGYAIVGYGVLKYEGNRFTVLDYGAIQTQAGVELSRRLEIIYDELMVVLLKWKPDVMAVEELFFTTNAKTAIGVGQGRGVILLAGCKCGAKIFEYTPLQVKQAVVGYGKADKQQVMELTKRILGLREVPKPDDTADALAIAVCHAHSSGSRIGALMNQIH
ncbi:MAG: crossover junction endodeoxyribonuclease RuvC [Clostridia bacterium]|nr:crossover junction endodeoxyribonuclease RuvC [Clostridia bacterium]